MRVCERERCVYERERDACMRERERCVYERERERERSRALFEENWLVKSVVQE